MLVVLRVFLGVQSFTFAVTGIAFLGHDSPQHAALSVWGMFAVVGVLLCASITRLVNQRWFDPLALGITFLLPAIGQGLALHQGPASFEKIGIELAFVLAVPVVLLAWRYPFRLVVALTLGGALVDGVLLAVSPLHGGVRELLGHVILDRTVALLIVGYVVSRLVGAQRREHAALEEAHGHLRRFASSLEQLSASRERNRVARELHDTLAHTLTAIAVQLEATCSEWKRDPKSVEQMLSGATELARSGLSDVRRALRELRASPLDDLGLVLSIQTLAEQCRERTGACVELELPAPALSLPGDVEQGLYRIVQEGLSNIERHARAQRVELGLKVGDQRVSLRIVDDGCGFDPAQVPQDRYGLIGLRERAALLGGDIVVRSVHQQGTSIELELELAARSLRQPEVRQ